METTRSKISEKNMQHTKRERNLNGADAQNNTTRVTRLREGRRARGRRTRREDNKRPGVGRGQVRRGMQLITIIISLGDPIIYNAVTSFTYHSFLLPLSPSSSTCLLQVTNPQNRALLAVLLSSSFACRFLLSIQRLRLAPPRRLSLSRFSITSCKTFTIVSRPRRLGGAFTAAI